ncbi:hypothetical protein [Streptomyces sp. NPDC127066]|uniref:SecDF P1 head subdomain-containing protein n=1 Tax=Streptomyces sp. NPDC127066 TaxID=3347125 RepID=UPI003651DA41
MPLPRARTGLSSGLRDVTVEAHDGGVTVTGCTADEKRPTELGASGRLGERGRRAGSGRGGAQDAALQARFAALDCTARERPATEREGAARDSVVACGTAGDGSAARAEFALGPTAVDGAHVASAEAVPGRQTGGRLVRLRLDSAGARQFSALTARLSMNAPPRNRMAIVLDGAVISAPSANQRLGDGTADIYGGFTRESAERLAVTLGQGALPAPVTVTGVTRLPR